MHIHSRELGPVSCLYGPQPRLLLLLQLLPFCIVLLCLCQLGLKDLGHSLRPRKVAQRCPRLKILRNAGLRSLVALSFEVPCFDPSLWLRLGPFDLVAFGIIHLLLSPSVLPSEIHPVLPMVRVLITWPVIDEPAALSKCTVRSLDGQCCPSLFVKTGHDQLPRLAQIASFLLLCLSVQGGCHHGIAPVFMALLSCIDLVVHQLEVHGGGQRVHNACCASKHALQALHLMGGELLQNSIKAII
mmetsp:Transcript_9382/g.23869  ORF Transcript_9382/g.23869 Transcript_9382/m.23869 type:complete len:243 (-) Transcript_9382:380-1108(-)